MYPIFLNDSNEWLKVEWVGDDKSAEHKFVLDDNSLAFGNCFHLPLCN